MKKLLISSGFLIAVMGSACSQQPSVTPQALNINFMNRGYFYASSPSLESTVRLGGWGGSDNAYQTLEPSSSFETGKLVVYIDLEQPIILADKFRGYTLYVVNTQSDTLFFEAQDSRLQMKLQAQDKNGEWKDIEYLPSSWCGNSYHLLYLPTSTYWKFSFPEYGGKIKTRIRAALQWKSTREVEGQWVYSNEFPGSVNPGQFTKKPKYTPNGIMDPYDN